MTPRVRVESWGPEALLVRYAVPGDASGLGLGRAIERELRALGLPGLLEITPGFDSLLLEFDMGACPAVQHVERALDGVDFTRDPGGTDSRVVELPVVYDGADLDRVARHAGLAVEEVIARHAAPLYRVRLLGFAPGFAYLDGLDERLHTPRLEVPRPRVPPGSVAIGGAHAGVYPGCTAGGWNLLGHTTVPLLDLRKAQEASADAFALQQGDGVRFTPVVRHGERRT